MHRLAWLLLAAVGGCTAIDAGIVTSRRAEPDSFQVRAEAGKVRDADGSRPGHADDAAALSYLPPRTVDCCVTRYEQRTS